MNTQPTPFMNNLPVLSSIEDGAIVITCNLTLGQLEVLRFALATMSAGQEQHLTDEAVEEASVMERMFGDTITEVTKEVKDGTYDREMVHGFCL